MNINKLPLKDARKLVALRWLQVKELRIKYPNDADFGHEVAKLIMKDE
tara:strand:+ start:174 stop:317 length:144 start_codon:yes stop_codon:yes gene_type:complete